MKAYQYEIESRLIKMLMCLCVVLSFAGCNSDEEIEGDPYAGGKEPYGIRFLVDAPSPDRAYPGELVTYKAKGLSKWFNQQGKPDFSFFMDGGKSSWAKSKDSVLDTVQGAGDLAASLSPDFAMIEEIDLDSTRSYHVNEYSVLKDCMSDYDCVFAQNYDSAFLFYPFTQPHGSSKSGLALFSRYPVTDSLRRSFPVSTSFSKFFDLDRCYSISRVPVDNGKELVIFELHMSAYGNSDEIREGQIQMLTADMKKEYDAGNYVLCGGDFNHDLKAAEDDSAERESWAYPFPRAELPDHFSFCIDQLSDEECASLWDSARNADMEYIPGETYTVTLDGFIVSDNIECLKYENINTGYSYSDHDPVYVQFKLQ